VLFDFYVTLGETFGLGFDILNIFEPEFAFRPLLAEELDNASDLSTRGLMNASRHSAHEAAPDFAAGHRGDHEAHRKRSVVFQGS
jgi:hypothetical protein